MTGLQVRVRDIEAHGAVGLEHKTSDFVTEFTGDVPGVSRIECGNYLLHDLEGAKKIARSMQPVLKGWTEADLVYKK